MNLRGRIERLERMIAAPEDFEEVCDRMRARHRLYLRKFLEPEEAVKTELSPEDRVLLAGDTDELRRADQSAWDKYAKASKITDLEANDGALYVPIAIRIGWWEAEDAKREDRQGAEIKKAMASLDRGWGIEHQRVEAWVVSLNSGLERLAAEGE